VNVTLAAPHRVQRPAVTGGAFGPSRRPDGAAIHDFAAHPSPPRKRLGRCRGSGDTEMKTIIGLCAGIAVAAMLSGCVGEGYGPGPGPVALAGCDGYYDDFYGPFDDGCWADDGGFWYRGHDGQYHRDSGGHFSHTASAAMHPVHGVGPGAGAHFGGGHGDDHGHG
jgi:hypothetical protein